MLWILETEKAESITGPGRVFLGPHLTHAELTSLDNATYTAHVPSPFPPPGDSERTKFLKPT